MPPRTKSARAAAPADEDEETFEIHSVKDSSDDDVQHIHARQSSTSASSRKPLPRAVRSHAQPTQVVDLSSSSATSPVTSKASARNEHEQQHHAPDQQDDDEMDFEDVDVSAQADPLGDHAGDEEEFDLEMEEVDLDVPQDQPDTPSGEDGLRDMYAAAYQDALHRGVGDGHGYPDDDEDDGEDRDNADRQAPRIPIFKDGKGQHRGVEISVGSKGKKQGDKSEAAKKRSETTPTARDRQSRINAHKLYVLSILAFARIRNQWCNDEALRDELAQAIPDHMITKYKAIHPKKVPEQRERVRMFESFITELIKWWAGRFRLDPRMTSKAALRQPNQDISTGVVPAPGRRIDGWLVESAADREKRHRAERQQHLKSEADTNASAAKAKKGKGRATASAASSTDKKALKPMEITLFMPGTAIRPVFLTLLPPAEAISSSADLLKRFEARFGSRETSAQLFCALCRALGIPARLVVSIQPMPWSVGASKLANTAPPTAKIDKNRPKSRLPVKPTRFRKPDSEATSDNEEVDDSRSNRSARSVARSRSSKAGTLDTDSSLSDLDIVEEVVSPRLKAARANQRAERDTENLARKAVLTATQSPRRRTAARGDEGVNDGAGSDRSTVSAASGQQSKGKAKAKGSADDEDADGGADYRPAKWRNLDAPLKVEPKAKLRRNKPKALKSTEVAPEDDSDVEPVDLQAPPTVWVEVFSKPFQKWITVDPVRSVVRATGNRWMEPAPTDRQNKLVYVVAVEEDGYARDVTARYTNKLNSRVARLRPPTRTKGEEDWWAKTVRAIHRPQKLDRDAMEDVELNDSASREAMPTSVAGYKDHPVYFLEKHLKRDEVVYPRNRIATFQGMPVFRRANVVTLRSARQWFNEGRVVKEGEEALKWVKSRGYTLANKRAEEQAKAEGREAPNEGLYAEFQTELYTPPPIVDGKIPTNAFGNIDLFVPSMLPKGAAHIPYNGAAKMAKKLGVSYAEAITGFEFRKHRGMPKITGIVVAVENEQAVLDAYWEHEHLAAERETTKRQERAIKAWKKLVNALRIAKRVKEQYGDGRQDAQPVTPSTAGLVDDGEVGGGGFLIETEEAESKAEREISRLRRIGMESQEQHGLRQVEEEVGQGEEEGENDLSLPPIRDRDAEDDDQSARKPTGPIVSLSSLVQAETVAPSPHPTVQSKEIPKDTPPSTAAKGRGRPKRKRPSPNPDEERKPSKAAKTPQTARPVRRSTRRSAAVARASLGGYKEVSEDDGS
ncbi:hypothetical protein ACQY0O_008369 [Thecaphora frezii]